MGPLPIIALAAASLAASGASGDAALDDGFPMRRVQSLHRYREPAVREADPSVFVRPDDAFTPDFWQRHSVCSDFRPMGDSCYAAGICGVVTTLPVGFMSPDGIDSLCDAYAPFYATNSLIKGIGDFWLTYDETRLRFVWKDLAFGRDPSNLVSFAADLYRWGDIEFTYGDIPESGFSSFVKLGGQFFDASEHSARWRTVRFEKNLDMDAEWYLDRFPDICSTNAQGEIVWDCDTNEWIMATFEFHSGEEESFPQASRAAAASGTDAVAECRFRVELTPPVRKVIVKPGNGNPIWIEANNRQVRYVQIPMFRGTTYSIKHIGGGGISSVAETSGCGVEISPVMDVSGAFSIRLPLDLSIENLAPDGADYLRLAASLSPPQKGGSFRWSADGDLRLMQSKGATVEVLRTGSGAGTVRCDWRKQRGRANIGYAVIELPEQEATKTFIVLPTEQEWKSGREYFSLSFDSPVAFFEPAHLDESGAKVPAVTPRAVLTVSYEGLERADVELSAPLGLDGRYSVRRDGEPVRLPHVFSMEGRSKAEFEVSASSESADASGAMFSADLRTSGGAGLRRSASVVFAKVEIDSAEPIVDGERRHVFGPMETVTATVTPGRYEWAERDVSRFGPFMEPTNVALSVSMAGREYPFTVSIVGPSGLAASNPRAVDPSSVSNVSFTIPPVGWIGSSFEVDLRCVPDYVSFEGLAIAEGEAEPEGATGYFLSHPGAMGRHGAKNGAGTVTTVDAFNGCGRDAAGYSIDALDPPLSDGGYHWDIPVLWHVPGRDASFAFATNRESFALRANGDFTVSKFGFSATRGTNGEERVSWSAE